MFLTLTDTGMNIVKNWTDPGLEFYQGGKMKTTW